MKKTLLAVLACASLLFSQSKAAPAPFVPTVAAPELHLEGENFTDILRTLYAYAQDGRYDREIAQVVKPAHDWIGARTARVTPNERLAVVFDIDETAISNLSNMLNCGFCSTGAQARLFQGVRLPAIPVVHDLYVFAKSKGLTIFFVTGRSESGREITLRDLDNAGYSGWEELLMRPSGNTDPARIVKATIRKSVEQKGYRIVLNIGDQLSDLIGGYSERTYKLPNPFYFVE